jgi:hypothetical protein
MDEDRRTTMSRAIDFFTSTVQPTVDEFLNDTKDIRRGRLAAIVLYHMADHWWRENKTRYQTLDSLRIALIAKCPDFQVIRDVGDASKHAELIVPTKIPRTLSSSEQVTRPKGLFQAPFGIGVFYEASDVVFVLDNGGSAAPAPLSGLSKPSPNVASFLHPVQQAKPLPIVCFLRAAGIS